jgi:hypothetical protein
MVQALLGGLSGTSRQAVFGDRTVSPPPYATFMGVIVGNNPKIISGDQRSAAAPTWAPQQPAQEIMVQFFPMSEQQ